MPKKYLLNAFTIAHLRCSKMYLIKDATKRERERERKRKRKREQKEFAARIRFWIHECDDTRKSLI